MSRLRVVMVFILSAVVFYGVWKYYTVNQNIYFQDPIAPAWEAVTDKIELDTLAEQTGNQRSLVTRLFQNIRSNRNDIVLTEGVLHPEFTTGRIAIAELQAIVRNGYFKGDDDARLILLDFCHFSSQYCQEAAIDGTISRYLATYSGDLSYQFRSYPPQSDESTLSPHLALQCAGQQGDEVSYFKFLHGLYLLDAYTLSSYQRLANDAGIDGFNSCILKQPNSIKIRQQMKQSDELFEITVLPTYILLDRFTGQYIKIPGLYRDEYVHSAINSLLDE